MRYLASLAIILLAQIGAAWATGDINIARPGAAFATLATETPAACERACADDTLCMAWSFEAGACELKAVVPQAIAREGAISGLSSRAPASMRGTLPATTAVIAAHEREPEAAATPRPEDAASLALLGGPDSDSDLRARLGN